jgi:hypothetical protein
MARMGKQYGPRPVAASLPAVTGKVLAKKGFPNMSLLTDWPAIVGPELAAYTCPEKLSWPRKPNDPEPDAAQSRPRGNKPMRGITLKLRVESHRALDVQYQLDQILDRINGYFGYRAVTDIRIIQGPVRGASTDDTPKDHPDHIKSQSTKPLADFSEIEDDGLRDALKRLDEARRGE